jgi:hypothetical protein
MSTAPERVRKFHDLQRLLAVVGLRHQQRVGVHPERPRVHGIERVLRVDERGGAARPLRLRDDRQGQRGLAARLGAVDLGDASARNAAHAERHVEAEAARADGQDIELGFRAELHDGALAELLLDLTHRGFEGLELVLVHDSSRVRTR